MKRMMIVLSWLVLAIACHNAPHGGHGHAHGEGGHDDHHGDHAGDGHGDHDHAAHASAHVTRLGERFELFVEYPTLVGGYETEIAVHATRLSDYSPVEEGALSVVLTGTDAPGERWEVETPVRPGVFEPTIRPKYAGERSLVFVLRVGDASETFTIAPVTVYADKASVPDDEHDHGGEVTFEKEQQWRVDFGLARVVRQAIRPSIGVDATVRPSAEGEAVVTAPFDGRIAAPDTGIPQVGANVAAGDVVAWVVPKLDASEIAAVQSELRKAEVALARARRDAERIRGLVESGALPARRLRDVESDVEIAQAEASRARQRLGQSNTLDAKRGRRNGAVAIRSAIDGTVAMRNLVEGGFVSAGQPLLRVVDRSRLWLEAHVPEANLRKLNEPTGVWFEPNPDAPPISIDVADGGQLVSFGEVIDPHTRTAPLIFAIGPQAEVRDVRAGAFVRAHVFNGEPREALTIPKTAILDEKGLDVVYVVRGGETFERRTVRVGVRDRGVVEILEGLEEGEIVVSEGAYFVKLAGTSTESMGHGHAH